MPELYSYVLVHDEGAAPNPFWGVCTLVLCKPVIRRTAEVGDWVVGTGSAQSPLGDLRGQMVYAMKVTGKMPMAQYDAYVRDHLPGKIPDPDSPDPRRGVGDAIYDFAGDAPCLRPGTVHDTKDRQRDLGGTYALLSEHFYYFGDQPVPLPKSLRPLAKGAPGHRSTKNRPYLPTFLDWLEGLDAEPNRLQGKPAGRFFNGTDLEELMPPDGAGA